MFLSLPFVSDCMRMVSDWVRMVEDEHSLGHHQEEMVLR